MILPELSKLNYSATVSPMQESDIDELLGQNLRRLRIARGFSQEDLAKKLGETVTKQRISAIENGREGMGKALLAKACEVLKANLWEFYWTEKVPIVQDESEQQDLFRRRESARLGIADMVREAEASWITAAKKKTASGGEGAPSRIQRKTKHPIPIDFNKEEREALRLYEKAEDLGVARKLDRYAAQLIAEARTQSGRGKKRAKIGHKK